MGGAQNNMIRLQSVSKIWKKRPALDDVSLKIGVGDRIALVGSNGAGKTTMIRCLLGEYFHDGDVEVFGLDPRRNRRDVLKRVGFVPQLPPPLKMPVGELIRFAAGMCESDPKQMEEVATRLGLDVDAIRSQPFVKLSGGQKQKLLIGIALGRECELLIMDEPAANLDPEARHVFFTLLSERQEGMTMLLSSHRLDEVAPLVNRVIELDRGKVVLDDHVADAVEMDSELDCKIVLSRHEEAFAKALGSWNFKPKNGTSDSLTWEGRVAGPDRLRFLGMISRYAAIIESLSMDTAADIREVAL